MSIGTQTQSLVQSILDQIVLARQNKNLKYYSNQLMSLSLLLFLELPGKYQPFLLWRTEENGKLKLKLKETYY